MDKYKKRQLIFDLHILISCIIKSRGCHSYYKTFFEILHSFFITHIHKFQCPDRQYLLFLNIILLCVKILIECLNENKIIIFKKMNNSRTSLVTSDSEQNVSILVEYLLGLRKR